MKPEFSAIKTYEQKDEVKQAIKRLVNNKSLYSILFKLSFPKAKNKFIHKFLKFFFTILIKHKLKKIQTTEEIQNLVKKYLQLLINKTTNKINILGVENLASIKQKPAIFISNHRDIVFDPALLNFALNEYGFDTTKIAIGDNLIKNPMIEDLMRLNKSFLVQRNIKGLKENLKAMQTLSEYIDFSIKTEKSSIWLAQRQGRAKDGLDKTDSGVLKMLCLANKKAMSLEDNISNLNIIPVAISYEYDPCDFLKAQELETIKVNGAYQKSDDEDIKSMKLGLIGQKGEVSIHFCKPINEDSFAKDMGAFSDIDKLAEYLDLTIATNYKLYSSNKTAFYELQELGKTNAIESIDELQTKDMKGFLHEKDEFFLTRLEKYPPNIRQRILEMYANPMRASLLLKK